MTFKIAAIVSFCTNDYRFLKENLRQLHKFSDSVLVVISDHFFNGEAEDRELLHRIYAEHPETHFIEFPYNPSEPFGLYSTPGPRHWHNTSRYIGYYFSPCDYLLFLDADEIIDGDRFQKWWDTEGPRHHEAILFASHIYVEDEGRRSLYPRNSGLLLKRGAIQPELLFNAHERPGIFFDHDGPKKEWASGLDGNPLVHHYAWVRSKKELLKKVETWGHRDDLNWKELIEESGFEKLTDLTFERITPVHHFLDVDVEKLSETSYYRELPRQSFKNLRSVTPRDLFEQSVRSLL